MRIVDLSVLISNTASEPMKMVWKRLTHEKGALQFCFSTAWNRRIPLKNRFSQLWNYILGKKRLTPSHFPEKLFLSLDTVTLPTHMGTHIDAPIHYGPLCEGKPAKSIEQLPLEWFFSKAIRLDMRHKKPGEYIHAQDIKDALASLKHILEPLTIVLLWTGNDKRWGTREYFSHAPGMSKEAVSYLVGQGIKVIGIDTYGIDRPFPAMLQDFWKTKDTKHLWPAHFYGRSAEYIHLERLANLEQLPDQGFRVACFPLKIKGLDASWVRAVGIIDD